jgi:hypothetical protein
MDFWRQTDLVDPDQLGFPLTLIGAGGIGSPVALAVAKMGCRRITLYDPDIVEQHNLPNQVYRSRDVGRPKVEALAELLGEFAAPAVQAIQAAVAGQQLNGVVVSAVDSMASRERIWRDSIRFRVGVPLYIDARMGAQVCRVLSVRPCDPDDVRRYEATLYADDAAAEDPCTAQAIIYTTFGVGALVANQIKRFACTEPLAGDIVFDFVTLTLLAESHL